MKKIVAFLFFCISIANAQDEYLDVIPYSYSFDEIGISPSEQIWIVNSEGNTYHTERFDKKWEHGPFGKTEEEISSKPERVTFFSDNTMIISGLIYDYPSDEGLIYRSDDGGKTWGKIKYGGNDWLDAAYSHGNKAWMSGSGSYIYYTDDTGKTWAQLKGIDSSKDFRIKDIYFLNDDKTGISGSFNGNIAVTKDNCKNWKNVPTPLFQKKTKNIYNTSHDIDKVRIIGNNYIVKQLYKVFITEISAIDWKLLPDVNDFEVTENGEIYLINKDNSITLKDVNFNTIWQSKEKLNSYPSVITVRNDNLFTYADNHMYKINKTEFSNAITLVNDTSIEEPYLQLTFKDEILGFDDKAILKYDSSKGKWYRYMEQVLSIRSAAVIDGTLIICNPMVTNSYIVNLQNKTTSPYNFPPVLFDGKKVAKFLVEAGSRGCFHNGAINREYIANGNTFILKEKDEKNNIFKKMDTVIDIVSLNNIVTEAEISRSRKVTIEDFDITQDDINNFKKIVNTEEKKRAKIKNNYTPPSTNRLYNFNAKADYNFYRTSADAINKVSPEIIEQSLKKDYGTTSTTVNWQQVKIEFEDNTYLTIENSDYMPGYYYTPWKISYNGLIFETTSIKLGQMIDNLTNGMLLDKKFMAKEYAIYKITDYLYDKSLDRE